MREEILDEMRLASQRVSARIRSAIGGIIDLAYRYSYVSFSFEDKRIQNKVLEILRKLSDEALEDIETSMRKVSEDDDEVIPFVLGRWGSPQERMDAHASNLYRILEVWIGFGIAEKVTATDLKREVLMFTNPRMSKKFREYLKKKQIVIDLDGKIFPQKGMPVMASTMVNEAHQVAKVFKYRKSGAIGYMVQRNSSYDCPLCDSLCGYVHPLSEICLPAHPNCVCSTYPVYE